MTSSKKNTSDLLTDKVAASLAGNIIKFQLRWSGWLNQRFNAYSTRGKKRIIIVFVLLTSVLLLAGSFCSFYTLPKLSQNYTTAHIGLPSDLPKPHISNRQLTDSLTKKN